MVSDIMQRSSERFRSFGKICPARATSGQCVIRKDFKHLSERFLFDAAWLDFVFDIGPASVSFGKISTPLGKISVSTRHGGPVCHSESFQPPLGKILYLTRHDQPVCPSESFHMPLGKISFLKRLGRPECVSRKDFNFLSERFQFSHVVAGQCVIRQDFNILSESFF